MRLFISYKRIYVFLFFLSFFHLLLLIVYKKSTSIVYDIELDKTWHFLDKAVVIVKVYRVKVLIRTRIQNKKHIMISVSLVFSYLLSPKRENNNPLTVTFTEKATKKSFFLFLFGCRLYNHIRRRK